MELVCYSGGTNCFNHLRQWHALRLSNSILTYIPERTVYIYLSNHTNKHVQSSSFYNSPKMETTQCLSTVEWINKVVCSVNRLHTNNENE